MEVLAEEEALGEVVVEALTEEVGEEEAMDVEGEVWTEMEATAETGGAWVELDLEIPDQEIGSARLDPVETPTLPGGRNATNVRRRKERIREMQVKEGALVEEGEAEDTVVVAVVDLEEAGEGDSETGVDGEVAAVDTGEASEATGEVAAEALVVGEGVASAGTGVEEEVVLVTGVVGEEGSGEIGVVAL